MSGPVPADDESRLRMTLVERFIDFQAWPTSRKTALLSGLGFAGFLLATLMLEGSFRLASNQTPVDERMIRQLMVFWTGVLALTYAASWAVARTGREGRWTFFLLFVPFGVLTSVATYLFGVTSTSLFALYPMVVLLLALWYGPRYAWFGFGFGLVCEALVLVFTAYDDSPFAPVFLNRDLEAQRDLYVVGPLFIIVMQTFVFCFVLVLLNLGARERIQTNLDCATALIRRYVPEQVADAVISGTSESIANHERRKLTVFFSDLVGFTDLSEELEPEDLANVLHDYFTEMSAIAKRHGGTVDDLVGDAILVLFGAPERTDDRDQALRAVRMAVEMQAAMESLNQRWASAGIPETLAVRMGVNTGVVTVGNFGSAERTKYTALGKQVNIAARIQAQCEPGKVLLSHATWLLIHDEITCTPKGELTLKGLNKPMPAYEVVSSQPH